MRLIASIVTFFLLLTSLEAWAGYWLAGRWFVSSRYATVPLSTVRLWLNRGIITSAIQQAKVFINRNGKWILFTLALYHVLRELEYLQQQGEVGSICYLPAPTTYSLYVSVSTSSVYFSRSYYPGYTYSVRSLQGDTCGGEGTVPAYKVYRYDSGLRAWVNDVPPEAWVPVPGTYVIGSCELSIELTIPSCPFSASPDESIVYAPAPSHSDFEQQRSQVPVRVFPNPLDFVRPDVAENDPALRWLRDEYQRIASDTSIPTIPPDALEGVELPEIDWSIPPEEASDSASESSLSRSTDDKGQKEGEIDISVPGLDTSLPSIQKRPFPMELINSLVRNHPLLRILQGITFQASGSASCHVGSGVFTIDFCPYAWVFNLMGAIIVPISFLVGLFGWRND